MNLAPALRLAATRRFLVAEDVHLIAEGIGEPDAPCRVIDLGAGSGTTALAALGASEHVRVHTVDINETNLDWAQKAVEAAGFESRWTRAHMTAVEAAQEFRPGLPVALVMHDAGHTLADVMDDLNEWHQVLDPGTPLWVHDYAAPPPDWGQPPSPGVAEALADLITLGRIEVTRAAGLGWLGRFR